MYIKLIACEIFFREICYCAAISKNIVDAEFLTQGYHDIPQTGAVEIQKRIDAVPPGKYDAIALGYGLCSKIVTGLVARHTPIVIPRMHDCITMFLGSRERYKSMFESCPGTYYYTSGWLECLTRRGGEANINGFLMPANVAEGFKVALDQLEKKYGKDNAEYLVFLFSQWENMYNRGVLINFEFARHLKFDEKVKEICKNRGWEYGEIEGDLGYLQRLLDGDWREDEFLILNPGEKIVATFDDKIIEKQTVS
ncbi:MAG: DUF1638 domain-containing protein [Verrucomicrobiia bacterium]